MKEVLELVLLGGLSVFSARFLEKRYKVAAIAHAVLFFITSFLYLFTINIPVIKFAMTNIVGEFSYNSLNEALSLPTSIFNYGLSAFTVIEIVIYVIVPLTSIVTLVEKIKEKFKAIKLRKNNISVNINKNINEDKPSSIFSYSKDDIYLTFNRLLN